MEVCKICGKSFNRLATHLTKAHNISMEEYEKLYDDSTSTSKVDVLKDDNINSSTQSNNTDFRDLPDPYSIKNSTPADQINSIDDNDNVKISTPADQINSVPDSISSLTTFQQEKETVLDLIKEKYPDAKRDYFINLGSRGILAVDFASLVEKIVFNFPNAFWHNQSLYLNEKVLNDNKWKVLNYYSLQDFLEGFSR